jgi:hypothetical protein
MSLHVSSTCAHRQEVKIVLYRVWYHHTYRWLSLARDLSIFILVINQLDAQNLFYSKFMSCLYMFRAPCAHHQEVRIVLYSLWYHHTYRWPSLARDLSIFILVINQLDAQNLFYSKFMSCLYMVRAPCAHHQEVKIVLYSLWYHHTYRWPSLARDLSIFILVINDLDAQNMFYSKFMSCLYMFRAPCAQNM